MVTFSVIDEKTQIPFILNDVDLFSLFHVRGLCTRDYSLTKARTETTSQREEKAMEGFEHLVVHGNTSSSNYGVVGIG